MRIKRGMIIVDFFSFRQKNNIPQNNEEKIRSAQKQELEEVRGIKNHVFVAIFNKAASEKKILDSSK